MPRAFVTGGGRGIGFAIASKLAEEGYSVTISGRDQARLEKSLTLLPAKEGQHHKFVVADYSDLTKEIEIDEDADILVNNAGINAPNQLVDMPEIDILRIANTNFTSVALISKKFIANCLKYNKSGDILNVSSNTSMKAFVNVSIYGALKCAMNHFTCTLAKEYGPKGIKVNAIAPGMTETDLTKGHEEYLQYNLINAGEFISPEAIADASWNLLSSRNITGAVLVVDNGLAL